MNVSAGKGLARAWEDARKHFLINFFDNSDKSFSIILKNSFYTQRK